ncbi:MAG: stomatin-like protein [Candidatus Algichlamydia australiensis]|nr:stomatin-like protein [Chlamydiales bacterium]
MINYHSLWVLLPLLIIITKAFHIVPQRKAYVVERLGKYHRTLSAGLNIIIPFVDRIAYRHSLKEIALDVAKQVCITRDNIAVEVDGVLYLQVMDPVKASYGITDYLFATTQIAQTTMRSVIGKLDLDQTFEEREQINGQIVEASDKASDPWGIKVSRYEIKDIKPPRSIYDAMEKQMRAEREKRAVIATSEGERQARINRADGEKQELIAKAEGKAKEIETVATAKADSIRVIAQALQEEGGKDALTMRLAENYICEFGSLAKANNTMIVPADVADLSKMIATATTLIGKGKPDLERLRN